MDLLSGKGVGSPPDVEVQPRKKKFFSLLGTLFLVWTLIGSGVLILPFFARIFNRQINIIADYLFVDPAFIQQGLILAFSASVLAVLAQTKKGQLYVDIIAEFLSIKRERSFYNKEFAESASDLHKRDYFEELDRIRVDGVQASLDVESIGPEEMHTIRERAIDALNEKLTVEVSEEFKKRLARDQIEGIIRQSLSRLSDQTIVLGSRANLTLWMGIIFCTVGLFALWYSFFISSSLSGIPAAGLEWVELAKSYAPRLTLVVLIEVIGFFFLKMYRATLSEIRYVQNEITNVEMRVLALNTALGESSSSLPMLVELLAQNDRNSIIEKGQTTVEIERHRANTEADKTVLEAVVSLLHGTDKASIWRR